MLVCQGSADTASRGKKPEEEQVSVRNTDEDASGPYTTSDDKTLLIFTKPLF
jgi:hypothetical protein